MIKRICCSSEIFYEKCTRSNIVTNEIKKKISVIIERTLQVLLDMIARLVSHDKRINP